MSGLALPANGQSAPVPVREGARAPKRQQSSLRARRLALAAQPNAPWLAAADTLHAYGDAVRGVLRSLRREAAWTQEQAAEAIAVLIEPPQVGSMLSDDLISRLERDRDHALSWTLRQFLAACLALQRSPTEVMRQVEDGVRRWQLDRQIAAAGADARYLARRAVAEEFQAAVVRDLPRLTIDEQRMVATTVSGLARAHGVAGHRTPADALLDAFARLDEVAGEAGDAGGADSPNSPMLPPGEVGTE